MALNPTKPISQAKVKEGTVLLDPGSPVKMLVLLHKGTVSVVNSTNNQQLYTLGPNSTPGFSSLLLQEELKCKIITSSESVISAFPVKDSKFTSMIMGKLNVGVMAARSLLQEIQTAYSTSKKLADYLKEMARVIDNSSLLYYKANPNDIDAMTGDGDDNQLDPLLPYIKSIVQEYDNNGGAFPTPITRAWLEEDHSNIFKKDYEPETNFDKDEYQFTKRILSLPMNIQGAVFKADVNILQGLCQRLAIMQVDIVDELYQRQHELNDGMKTLLDGEYSFTEKFFLLADTISTGILQVSEKEFRDGMNSFVDHSGHFLQLYENYFASNFQNISSSYKKLESFLEESEEANAKEDSSSDQTSGVEMGTDMMSIKNELEGAPAKIMKFAGMEAEKIKTLTDYLTELRAEKNPLDSTPELRKLRRQISKLYFETYEKAYHKFQESRGNVPIPVRLMLNFGFFDDEFLEMEHLKTLYNLSDTTRANPQYPIFTATDWIKYIAEKKEACSIDEMGMTFFEKLKNEYKDQGWKKETEVPDEYDNYNIRVNYEIMNFLETNVKLTSGSPATAFPILTKYHITIDLDKSLVTYEKLSEALDKIREIDYSCFMREVLYNDEEAGILKEFIQQEVIPNFILVPSIGTKVMMWQEVAGRSKSSQGRIAVPMFATADLFTLLLDAVGAFRWELTKTIMGPDWNNVSVPSITADYTDYVQFYKKNRDLSPEIKEKLAGEFKRFRTDRDRFVNDYTNWVKYESEGVLKLNKVSRGIFYRHIPFARAIRANIATQPAYSDLDNRLTNIRRKKLKELEVRYRKYGDFETLPDVLKHNVEFYKV